jgi:NitT/TauT family transport system substrate-binding protein
MIPHNNEGKSMNISRRSILGGICLVAFAPVMSRVASAQTPVRVGFGTTWPTFSHLQIAQSQGLLGDLQVEITVLEDPLRGYQMLSSGQLDILFGTLDYAPIAASQNLPFKLVSALDISFGADQIVLAPGLKPADLKGAKVGATTGFVGELYMTEYLSRNGLKPFEVEWVNISPDQIVGPMVSGDIKAAYVYDPWTSQLEKALPGTQRVLTSDDAALMASGILEDALYMSDDFLANRAGDADRLLKSYFEGVKFRGSDPVKGNALLAEYTKWPVGDVEFLVGQNGKANPGGMYVIDFDEAARQVGALGGDGPLGQKNGALKTALVELESGWVRRGTLKAKSDKLGDILDSAPLQRLVDSGYRSSVPYVLK